MIIQTLHQFSDAPDCEMVPFSFCSALISSLLKSKLPHAEVVRRAMALGVKRATAYRHIHRLSTTGCITDMRGFNTPRPVCTAQLAKAVKARIRRNCHRSLRKMAKQMKVPRESLRRMVKNNLGLKSLKMRKTHMLNDRLRVARRYKCKQLLSRYAPDDCKSILFSDEKLFNVEVKWNSQNDRVLAANVSAIPPGQNRRQRTQHPASVMVWAGVSHEGKTPLVFIPNGVKINKEVYISHILEPHVKSLTHSIFHSRCWTFQQDSAPSHRAKVTQRWCEDNLPQFISTEDWPASSPDLNPMDYGMWSILEQKVCTINHSSVSHLKKSLLKAWEEIPLETVRATVGQWRTRLRTCVKSKGGHFEV